MGVEGTPMVNERTSSVREVEGEGEAVGESLAEVDEKEGTEDTEEVQDGQFDVVVDDCV